MRKEDWDVEFAAEILRRENEGQVTKPHQGRFDHKEKTKKTAERGAKRPFASAKYSEKVKNNSCILDRKAYNKSIRSKKVKVKI